MRPAIWAAKSGLFFKQSDLRFHPNLQSDERARQKMLATSGFSTAALSLTQILTPYPQSCLPSHQGLRLTSPELEIATGIDLNTSEACPVQEYHKYSVWVLISDVNLLPVGPAASTSILHTNRPMVAAGVPGTQASLVNCLYVPVQSTFDDIIKTLANYFLPVVLKSYLWPLTVQFWLAGVNW